MAQVSFTTVPATMDPEAGQETPSEPRTAAIAIEQPPPKIKGRQRLIRSLQRISSSPSLPKLSKTSSYNATGGASMSCVSLASPTSTYGHSYGSSWSSQFSAASSNGFSTAPTSVASTPGADMRFFGEFKHRVRVLDGKPKTPLSVPVPSGIQYASLGKSLASSTSDITEASEDYFSCQAVQQEKVVKKRENFSLWKELPDELRVEVLRNLTPKEIVRCSAVSKQWYATCFDGQLWASLDASKFYREIPGESLVKVMKLAGPFLQDLNLRGCSQMHEHWASGARRITEVCRNLRHFSIEGCKIDPTSVHYFLLRNPNLVHVNLSGCDKLDNSAMRILAQGCTRLEYLNVSWCKGIDGKGILKVVESCTQLKDLRAAEVSKMNDEELLLALFERNALERLLIPSCSTFDSDALTLLMQGKDADVDILTGSAIVPPRRFRHLDFHRCKNLTDAGLKSLVRNTPNLEGLRVSQCTSLTDEHLPDIFATCPKLTHLDLEELELTNATLIALSKSPCAPRLVHLNISYCENVGDQGILPVLGSSPSLRCLEMDNTRVTDIALVDISRNQDMRNYKATVGNANGLPKFGLQVIAYDCANVTWTGVREVLRCNQRFYRRADDSTAPVYPKEIINLKCFYGYQPTVKEHTVRVLKGELMRASILEKKWADYMFATEEAGAGAGAGGMGSRRRRRRLREAERAHQDEEEQLGRGGRRPRARSGGCTIM